jgi:hypothetical protein
MKIYQLAVSVVMISMICLSGADAYQIQKWVDKDGKVHYGDKTVAPQTSQSMQMNVKEGHELKAPKPRQEAEKKKKPEDEKIEPSDVASASCIGFAKKILVLKMDPSIDPQDDSKKIGGLLVSIRQACPKLEVECTVDTAVYKNERCETRQSSGDGVVFRGRVNQNNYLMKLAK